MTSRFRVRRIFRGLVLRLARPLARAGVRPDTITYSSLLFALMAFLSLVLLQSSLLFGCFVFIAGLLDGVDGAVARERGVESRRGAFIDSVVDKMAELMILLAILLAFAGSVVAGVAVEIWVLLSAAGWLLTSYTRARAESLGVDDLDIGVGGRSERLLFLVVFSLLDQLLWGLLFVTLLSLATAGYRIYHYSDQIGKEST